MTLLLGHPSSGHTFIGSSWKARPHIKDLLTELARREKAARIFPEPEVDPFMKATAMEGVKSSLQTDYTLRIIFVAIIASTVFIRSKMHSENEGDGTVSIGALPFGLIINMFNGFAELSLTIARLPVFYKQRDLLFCPAWIYTLRTFITRIPISILEAMVWVIMTFYSVGFAPEASRSIQI